MENSVVSFAAVGLGIDAEAASEANAACEGAQALIGSLFQAVLACVGAEDEETGGALLPFLGAYVSKIKAAQKRAGGTLLQVRACLRHVTAGHCATRRDSVPASLLRGGLVDLSLPVH